MTLRTDQLDYTLPEDLIACAPAQPRDSARMMVVRRSDPNSVEHCIVRDLPAFLTTGDLLVRNRTWVHPARLIARRSDTGGRVEGLYLDQSEPPDRWLAMLKSNGRLREGQKLDLLDARGEPTSVCAELVSRSGDHWTLRIECDSIDPADARAVLARVGATPLPPYIERRRRMTGFEAADRRDRAWYRVIDALDPRHAHGSVAAPTAGMHFTHELLDRLTGDGIQAADLLLHVGAGTFKPIETGTVAEHPMHSEVFAVPAETIAALRTAEIDQQRVIAVGTTTARALESLPADLDAVCEGLDAETSILIEPGHAWRRVDGLLTNFHLPRSTLLAMVGAMLPEGIDRLLTLYREAIGRGYRFYSYGDAMLILP